MVDDEELIELVEEEVRDLLDENGFDRDCPVIHTSAYGALHDDAPDHEKWVQSVKDLMDAVDDYIPTPVHDLDKPFLMPIEDVFTISGRPLSAGRVERGQLPVNTRSDRWYPSDPADHRHLHRDLPQDHGRLRGWRQHRSAAAWSRP